MGYLDDFSGSNQSIKITITHDDSHVQVFELSNQNNAVIYAYMATNENLHIEAWTVPGTQSRGLAGYDSRVPNVTEEEFNAYYEGINSNRVFWDAQSYAPITQIQIEGDIPVVISSQDTYARNLIPASGMVVSNLQGIDWQSIPVFVTGLVKNYSKLIKIYHDIYIDKPEEGEAFRPPFVIHTHHNVDFSNVDTYINFGIAFNGAFDMFNYGLGSYSRLGTSQYDMGMLQALTFEAALANGISNWKLKSKDTGKKDAVAFHFKDVYVENASQQELESSEAVIKPDGSHDLVTTPHPNIFQIIRFFDGPPPQDVIDSSDDGDGPDDYDYDGSGNDDDGSESSSDDIPDGSMEGSAGIFHDIYKVSNLNIKSLHNKLWTQEYFDVLKVNENPIDNIISCKRFPFDVDGSGSQSIRIGNIDTGVSGIKLSDGVAKIPMGSCSIGETYNNFLDYYSQNVTLFLPFIGFTPLPNSQLMTAGSVSVTYLVDIVTGACKAQIKIGSNFILERDGQMGIDCTLTASTQKQSEIANASRYASLAAGGFAAAGEIASGNIAGGIGGLANTAIQFANNAPENRFQSTATSASISNASKIKPFLIIDKAIPNVPNVYPNNYASTVGIPCGKTMSIGSLYGFIKCGGEISCDFSNATQEEQDEILSIMRSGFRL